MFENLTASRFGLPAGCAAAFLIAVAVQAQLPPKTKTPEAVPAPKIVDLEKQVEDALKEIDKLDKKVVPDDLREELKRRALQAKPPVVAVVPPARLLGTSYTIGLQLHVPPPVLVDHLQLPADRGLLANDVRPDTVAAKLGIMKNDILMELNGKPIPNNVASFNNDLKEYKQGATLVFGVIRHGKKATIKSDNAAQK